MDTLKEPDMEEQFILRLPEEYARELEERILSSTLGPNELKIKAKTDRIFHIDFAGTLFEGVLADLPCIIEAQKTLDNESFYKSGDISQILICSAPSQPADTKQLYKDFKYPHGLTVPMQDARSKHFRKIRDVHVKTQAEIAAEVDKLIRDDAEALVSKVEYEIVNQDYTFLADEDDDMGEIIEYIDDYPEDDDDDDDEEMEEFTEDDVHAQPDFKETEPPNDVKIDVVNDFAARPPPVLPSGDLGKGESESENGSEHLEDDEVISVGSVAGRETRDSENSDDLGLNTDISDVESD